MQGEGHEKKLGLLHEQKKWSYWPKVEINGNTNKNDSPIFGFKPLRIKASLNCVVSWWVAGGGEGGYFEAVMLFGIDSC